MVDRYLIMPDGTKIGSGIGAAPALQKLTLTQTVNPETELAFGAVCCQMLEATLWAPEGLQAAQAGDQVWVYEGQSPVGAFVMEKPQRNGSIYKLTAYDSLCLLDKDLTNFIAGLDGWPYSLFDLTGMIFKACGLEFANQQIPNGDLPVQKFQSFQVTGRQLIGWAAEAAGSFCRINHLGQAEFAWYTPSALIVKDRGDGFYYAGSLTYADYAVPAVESVQIRQEEKDVGTIYPPEATGEKRYIVEGNPFLTATSATSLAGVAQVLLERLQQLCYTPCQLAVPSALQVSPGQIIQVAVGDQLLTVPVMKRKRTGGKDTLYCTGSASRPVAQVRNQTAYKALSGKVLRLQTDVDGIRAEHADLSGNFALMQLQLEGVCSQVQSQQETEVGIKTQLSKLELDSRSLQLQLQTTLENGVSKVVTSTGYSFTEDGLRVCKDGQEMENRLDHTGMYVLRSNQVILQANNQGVVARDVTAHNYLVMGEHARFEDYSDGHDIKRTACFYIGG